MIKWKDEYSIGVEKIDLQHKHLFEIANRIYETLKNQFCIDKYDKILEILKELEEYTIYHFKEEEDYMKEIGYENYFLHKIEHQKFINKLKETDLEKIDFNQDGYLLDLLNFISDWLVKHILKDDKAINSAE